MKSFIYYFIKSWSPKYFRWLSYDFIYVLLESGDKY